jgi:4,5-DOPA dioxygenase extradiol
MKLKDLYKTGSLPGKTGKMPVLFLGHGSPMNAIEENEFVAGFRRIGQEIPRPSAVLCISAHWETRGTFVTAMEKPPTIHDFGGFPKELFEVQYPAPGDPVLARQIKEMVKKTEAGLDQKWGIDHGAWSVVKHLYPDADVPVLQMSLDYYQTIRYHYELASELAALRNRGVLIIGSGNMVHNLGKIAWDRLNDDEYSYEWASQASQELKKHMLDGNHDRLINYMSMGPSFRLAIPTPEHYLPLLYTLALREQNEEIALFNDRIIAGSISMTSVKIGT